MNRDGSIHEQRSEALKAALRRVEAEENTRNSRQRESQLRAASPSLRSVGSSNEETAIAMRKLAYELSSRLAPGAVGSSRAPRAKRATGA